MPSSTCYPVVGGSGERGWSTRVHTLSRENGGERERGRQKERKRAWPCPHSRDSTAVTAEADARSTLQPKGERSFDPFSFLSFPPDRLLLSSSSSSSFFSPSRLHANTRNTTVIYLAGSRGRARNLPRLNCI